MFSDCRQMALDFYRVPFVTLAFKCLALLMTILIKVIKKGENRLADPAGVSPFSPNYEEYKGNPTLSRAKLGLTQVQLAIFFKFMAAKVSIACMDNF